MPRGLFNWTYSDVTEFLKERDFEFLGQRKGSHEAWINTKTQAVVDINFHGANVEFRPRTFETMIRQSKIEKKVWRKWAGS